MYSVMLAAMLTTGAETTSWGWRCHGCGGCSGCHGAFVIGHGCHNYCNGCFSSCAFGCHGCSSGCHVTVVLGGRHGCQGCSSCHGCWSSSCHGCWSCSGGAWCHGCTTSCNASHGAAGGGKQQAAQDERVTPPAQRAGALTDTERRAVEELLRKMRERKSTSQDGDSASVPSNKARVVVRAPADARLWVDQVECPLAGAVRSFDTPALNPGQSYAYTLRIAVQRNGQTVEETRRVPITPGERVEVDLSGVGAVRTAQN